MHVYLRATVRPSPLTAAREIYYAMITLGGETDMRFTDLTMAIKCIHKFRVCLHVRPPLHGPLRDVVEVHNYSELC